jgi:plasmid stabilization system protein ParE
MMRAVVLRREARLEFDVAFDWYERQRPGLGDDFVACVQQTFDRIAKTPELHERVVQDIRRASVHRFPYSVYYTAEANRITVIAVFHSNRDPSVWQSRAR